MVNFEKVNELESIPIVEGRHEESGQKGNVKYSNSSVNLGRAKTDLWTVYLSAAPNAD